MKTKDIIHEISKHYFVSTYGGEFFINIQCENVLKEEITKLLNDNNYYLHRINYKIMTFKLSII